MITEQGLTATEVSAQELATPIAPARCSGVCHAHAVYSRPYGWTEQRTSSSNSWVVSGGFFCPRQFVQFLQLLELLVLVPLQRQLHNLTSAAQTHLCSHK